MYKRQDLGIGSIISDSVVEIRADHVVKAVTSETNIKAAALRILKSSAIGTKEQNLRTEISGNIEMISAGDIYATELGTANVKNIRSTKNEGKVSLTASGMVNCAEGGSAAITADNITPVSYTHLDVYKRQGYGSGSHRSGDLGR